MAKPVRVIFYTGDVAAAPELRRQITGLSQIRIVAELDEPSLLAQAVAQFPAEVLIADLGGPMAGVVIECISQLSQLSPELSIIALNDTADGGVILRAMRAGVKEYLLKPLKTEELAEALGRTVATRSVTKEPGKLISVLGSCGGVGATTLAVNLAVELAYLVGPDQKVAVVDLDFRFGHVATLLDVAPQFTVADLCSTPEQIDPQMIQKALVKHESGVYVLGRPNNFAQAEMITAAHCMSVLSGLQEMCAYVVVDGPTRHDSGGRAVLDVADYNLMVLQLLVTSVRNADRMLQELGVQGFNPERIQLVCNRAGRESAHLDISDVEKTLNRKMYVTVADDWKSVSTSINVGHPLRTEFERTKVCQAIQHLALKIHAPDELAAAEASQRGGLLGKFFKKSEKSQAAASEAAAVS